MTSLDYLDGNYEYLVIKKQQAELRIKQTHNAKYRRHHESTYSHLPSAWAHGSSPGLCISNEFKLLFKNFIFEKGFRRG